MPEPCLLVAVVERPAVCRARQVDIAQGEVIEDAAAADAFAKRRIARRITGGSVFGVCQRIILCIRVAPAFAGGLIDQGLDTCHDGRSDRSSPKAGPAAGRTGASRSSVDGV